MFFSWIYHFFFYFFLLCFHDLVIFFIQNGRTIMVSGIFFTSFEKKWSKKSDEPLPFVYRYYFLYFNKKKSDFFFTLTFFYIFLFLTFFFLIWDHVIPLLYLFPWLFFQMLYKLQNSFFRRSGAVKKLLWYAHFALIQQMCHSNSSKTSISALLYSKWFCIFHAWKHISRVKYTGFLESADLPFFCILVKHFLLICFILRFPITQTFKNLNTPYQKFCILLIVLIYCFF